MCPLGPGGPGGPGGPDVHVSRFDLHSCDKSFLIVIIASVVLLASVVFLVGSA